MIKRSGAWFNFFGLRFQNIFVQADGITIALINVRARIFRTVKIALRLQSDVAYEVMNHAFSIE